MENHEALDTWILNSSVKLNSNIKLFSNSNLTKMGIFDITVEIEIDGVDSFGRGTDFDRNIAIRKAMSEALERFYLKYNKFPNSNGMAAHFNKANAIENAKNELIERDLFLCNFLTSTPFSVMEASSIEIDKCREILRKGVRLNFYKMGEGDQKIAVLCTIDGIECEAVPFGYFMGTSVSNNLKSAINSAFCEAYRSFAHFASSENTKEISERSFLNMRAHEICFEDHGYLSLNLDYAKKLREIYFEDKFAKVSSILTPIFVEQNIPVHSLIEDCPLIVARVTSSSLQNLYCGFDNNLNANLGRLKEFSKGLGRELLMISKMPHPFN